MRTHLHPGAIEPDRSIIIGPMYRTDFKQEVRRTLGAAPSSSCLRVALAAN